MSVLGVCFVSALGETALWVPRFLTHAWPGGHLLFYCKRFSLCFHGNRCRGAPQPGCRVHACEAFSRAREEKEDFPVSRQTESCVRHRPSGALTSAVPRGRSGRAAARGRRDTGAAPRRLWGRLVSWRAGVQGWLGLCFVFYPQLQEIVFPFLRDILLNPLTSSMPRTLTTCGVYCMSHSGLMTLYRCHI